MKIRPILLLLGIVGIAACMSSRTTAQATLRDTGGEKPLRVLLVGNSLTFYNDMPAMLQAISIADKGGKPLEIKTVVHGGWTLEKHWESGEALKAIRGEKWDYVVLQEQSTRPITEREKMFTAAHKFDDAIDGSGARPVLMLTWNLDGKSEQQSILTQAYTKLGREIDATVAPVGEAWAKARQLRASLKLHGIDGKHPSATGSYLAACVIYHTITGRPVTGIHTSIKGVKLSADDEALLQKIATDTPVPVTQSATTRSGS